MKPFTKSRSLQSRKRGQRGSMLLELLVAIIVLAIGMGGILILLVSSMYTNSRSGNDTTSTMVAEHVIEQISSQAANATAPLSVTDCNGTAWAINTAPAVNGGGSSGAYGGNGAALTATGLVDWTQTYANVPGGYAMRYVACGAAAQRITYDVRWNVIALNTSNNSSRMIVASARPSTAPTVGGLRYVIPVNLRTVGGMP